MMHTWVSDEYIHFILIYKTDLKNHVLPIKHVESQDAEPATPYKLATGTKSSALNLSVLFCPCVVRKATAHVETNMLNMWHHSQKVFRGIFGRITQHKKG